MRLWHKDLIQYLPDLQLKGQWRECALIADGLSKNGTPNHLLVNRVMEYPAEDLWKYFVSVACEMESRGLKVNYRTMDKVYDNISRYRATQKFQPTAFGKDYQIFKGWHNKEYLRVCMANLYEKHYFGIGKSRITDEEWKILLDGYKEITGEEYKI